MRQLLELAEFGLVDSVAGFVVVAELDDFSRNY